MKKLAKVLLTALVVMSMVGCSSKSADTPPQKEAEKEVKEFYGLNEPAVLEGSQITVTAIEKSQGSSQFDKPKEGQEFVIVSLTIENVQEKEISYNPFYFKMQNSQGQILDTAFTTVNTDTSLHSGNLASKGSITGTLAFEQPVDDTDLTLIFTPSLISKKELKIKLQ